MQPPALALLALLALLAGPACGASIGWQPAGDLGARKCATEGIVLGPCGDGPALIQIHDIAFSPNPPECGGPLHVTIRATVARTITAAEGLAVMKDIRQNGFKLPGFNDAEPLCGLLSRLTGGKYVCPIAPGEITIDYTTPFASVSVVQKGCYTFEFSCETAAGERVIRLSGSYLRSPKSAGK